MAPPGGNLEAQQESQELISDEQVFFMAHCAILQLTRDLATYLLDAANNQRLQLVQAEVLTLTANSALAQAPSASLLSSPTSS
jgi:hypothetical protein